MKLAMYRGEGTFFDKLIRFATFSQYSHCELVIDGICYSSSPRDGGVRMKTIRLDDNWDVYDIKGNKVEAIEWFLDNVAKKYDWVGAITSILPFSINTRNRYFCSEACA